MKKILITLFLLFGLTTTANAGLIDYVKNWLSPATGGFSSGFSGGSASFFQIDGDDVSFIDSAYNFTTKQMTVSDLISCDTIDTDANGLLSCGTDASGAGGTGSNWQYETNFGADALTASSSIPVWFKDAVYASSTIKADGSITTDTAFYGDYWKSATNNSMAIQPTGDTDDFFSFKTPAHRPTIKREGGKFIYLESSNVYDVGISARADDTYSGTLNYEKDNHMMTMLGKNSPLGFKANSDYDDYIKIQTTSNIPEITVASSSALKINAGGTNSLLLNHSGGNVGVGTTSPYKLLSVAGAGHFDGAITADGNITGANLNISNWDTAHGWGDHSGVYDILGQATSTITDHTTTYNHANYDTAYGWSNHADAGYNSQAFASSTYAIAGGAFHDGFSDFVANEHLDWTQNVGTIHAGNYTDTNTQLSSEQVDAYVNALLKDADSVHTRITLTYDDANNAFDFVVDDMNDDVPDAGDFGNAVDLDANGNVAWGNITAGELADNTVQAADIDTIACGTNCTWDATNDEIDIDDAFLINSGSDIAGTGSGFTWGFNASAGSDPVMTFGDGIINVTTGALQVGGAAVQTGADLVDDAIASCANANACTLTADAITDNLILLADFAHSQDYGDFTIGAGESFTLDTGTVADNEIDYANVTLADFDYQTAWRVFYSNTDGDVTELALGADGTYLKSNGAAVAPTFESIAAGGDITDVFNCSNGDCNTMTVGTSEYLTYGTGYIDANRFAGVTTVDATEFGYLNGVTSAIQTQFSGKQGTLTNSAGLLAALSDETGSGLAVFGTSPTFTTGITVPADSISHTELSEGDAFVFTGSVALPQGTPTIDGAGEIGIDTTSDQLVYYGGAKRVIPYYHEKCFTIEDIADTDDNIPIWSPNKAITITDVYCRTQGGTSAVITLSDGTNALEAITCDADGQADDGSITNGAFTANERMEFDTGTVTGAVDWTNVCWTYTITAD